MNHQYHHSEGVHYALTGYDLVRWPLQRYAECLKDGGQLNRGLDETYRDLRAKHGPGLDTTAIGLAEEEEKYALRWHGLKLLQEVDNDESME